MIPVYQRNFARGSGDCFAACLASVMEISLDEVPNLCAEEMDADGSTWMERTVEWLQSRGWGFVYFPYAQTGVLPAGCWVIAGGSTSRADESHAVVGRVELGERTPIMVDGKPGWNWAWQLWYVHDPHPSGWFLDGDPDNLFVLFPSRMQP